MVLTPLPRSRYDMGVKQRKTTLHDLVLYGGAILTGGLLAALPYLWSQLEPGKH
ncbi:hypothetical protein [Synechococcus phage S-B68]|nr:hypothetical protein [Synechococcus phage S-B68]